MHKKDILTCDDIDAITDIFKFDVERETGDQCNCLIMACLGNMGLTLIKYLIEGCEMDTNHVNRYNDNCLTLACLGNTCLEVIKYLIEGHLMNANHVNQDNDNCLTLACQGNCLEVIKYLIEGRLMNTNHVNRYNANCLTLACLGNKNLEVIKYLTDECLMNIENIEHILFDRFYGIVSAISKKYSDLNNLLLMGWTEYPNNDMKQIIDQINPLQLNDRVRNLAGIDNPYNGKFKTFAQHVDELMCCPEPIFVD